MTPSRYIGFSSLLVACAWPLLQEAEYSWESWTAPLSVYVARRRGWVVITEEEFTELGIPERSRRGLFDTSEYIDLVLVDRRCLKRYRRKAGRRRPTARP